MTIMYKLNHDRILKLYDHFEDEEYIYLVLEYAENSDLKKLLEKQGEE